MTTWQEPRPGTQPARIVQLLRRPEGVTFREIADKLKVKSPIARTYLSTLRCGGCPVQEREEEGRGRVFYVERIDRRRKKPGADITKNVLGGQMAPIVAQAHNILLDYADNAPARMPSRLDRAFLQAAATAILHNPALAVTIQADVQARYRP